MAVATPTSPAPHAPTKSMNIGGAPVVALIVAMTIPPPPAFVMVAAATKAALATSMSVATQTAPDRLVKGTIGSGEAGSC